MVKYLFNVSIKGSKVCAFVGQTNSKALFLTYARRKNLGKIFSRVRRVLPRSTRRNYTRRVRRIVFKNN